jgi:hypothetical protein
MSLEIIVRLWLIFYRNIIEVDAVNVVPKVFDSFKIYAGESAALI